MATSKGNGKVSKANGKGRNQREERLQIMLAPEELSAVRELIRLGLASVDSLIAQPGTHSREYGVLNTPQRDGDAS
jgi:hypothetical protein